MALILVASCARRSSPSGGEKDSIPPILIASNPKINSVNFDADEIRLTFDEWVKLEKLDQQLIISPPLEKKQYEIKPLSGITKKIFVNFLDSLQENTTYTFNFGNSIVDNNEGNEMNFFSYTFSTGPTLDSLYLKGNIEDAFNLETEEYLSLQLYKIDSTYNDSIIFNEQPTYIANTLDSTSYRFNNLRKGRYILIALKDVGNNYIFNPLYGKIGYYDSIVSLPKDSIINLRLFKEETPIIWDKPHFINSEKIGFGYYGKLDLGKIHLISKIPDSVNYLFTKQQDKDTLYFWLSKNSIDSLEFNLKEIDTIKALTVKFDRTKDSLIDSLSISSITKSVIGLKENFKLSSNLPIKEISDSLIFIRDIDSILIPFKSSINNNLDEISLDFDIRPQDEYSIYLLPNAIVDLRDGTNDTLGFTTLTQSLEDYGNVSLNVIRDTESEYILQMINSNNEIVREYNSISIDGIFNFELITPGKYIFRMIKDDNGNKIWDTGNYLKRVQPEAVYYSNFELDIRANWDFNETFNLNEIKKDSTSIVIDSIQ
ncbi:MAG: Ig-like domain-containing protein [Pelagibacterales bacterium]|nr:Ig-like domain-containing protein [Pelagibacterales bacterium]